jgi:hypothetical protein
MPRFQSCALFTINVLIVVVFVFKILVRGISAAMRRTGSVRFDRVVGVLEAAAVALLVRFRFLSLVLRPPVLKPDFDLKQGGKVIIKI